VPRVSSATFVGRAAELADLDPLLWEVEAGRGQLAFVAGEPGVGTLAAGRRARSPTARGPGARAARRRGAAAAAHRLGMVAA